MTLDHCPHHMAGKDLFKELKWNRSPTDSRSHQISVKSKMASVHHVLFLSDTAGDAHEVCSSIRCQKINEAHPACSTVAPKAPLQVSVRAPTAKVCFWSSGRRQVYSTVPESWCYMSTYCYCCYLCGLGVIVILFHSCISAWLGLSTKYQSDF